MKESKRSIKPRKKNWKVRKMPKMKELQRTKSNVRFSPVRKQSEYCWMNKSMDSQSLLVQAPLNRNKDVFASSSRDLEGVSRDIIEHKLKISDKIKPRKQKLRRMSDEKVLVVKAEVQRDCWMPWSSGK